MKDVHKPSISHLVIRRIASVKEVSEVIIAILGIQDSLLGGILMPQVKSNQFICLGLVYQIGVFLAGTP